MINPSNPHVAELVSICRKVGVRPDYVQGGGGNISTKLDSVIMAVKASGFHLKDVSQGKGLCFLNYRKVREYLELPATNDNAFAADIKGFKLDDSNIRPSMEAGFHAVLGHTVIHTHSVYVNVFTCSLEGPSLLKTWWPDSHFFPYCNPGRDLTLSIFQSLGRNPSGEKILFLANHGLIVSADSAERAFQLHESINDKLISEMDSNLSFTVQEVASTDDLAQRPLLFPDQLIYNLPTADRSGYLETLAALNFISSQISKKGLSKVQIGLESANQIQSMDSEKYRKELKR